jgi:L-lactate dehydrogenase
VGAVGDACAHLLASSGIARSLVLANRTIDNAEAVRMDLEQSRSWSTPLSARAVVPWRKGAFSGCDVVILTAGPRLRGGESKADKAAQTADILRGSTGQSIVEALAWFRAEEHKVPPVLLVVTNPVEATVTWLAETTGWDHARIMGLGTTVETARFSRFLADRLNVDETSVWTEIVGEHGPMIDVRDEQALRRRVRELTGQEIDLPDLLERTRIAASEIRALSEKVGAHNAARFIERMKTRLVGAVPPDMEAVLREELAAELSPPATRFAIAAAALEVVKAIGSDRGRVLPVAGLTGFSGMPEVALALPFVVGRSGLLAPNRDVLTPRLREVAVSISEQVDVMRVAARARSA